MLLHVFQEEVMGRYYRLPKRAAVVQLWLIVAAAAVVALVVIVRSL